MIASQLMAETITPLRSSDTGATALELMDELRVSQLPIVDDEEFLGLISETDILTYNNLEEPVGKHPLSLTDAYILENQHIYDVIRLIDAMKLTLVPVLDEKKHYLGAISLVSLSHNLSKLMALDNPGGIIILELNDKDYLLTEIAQIVESNRCQSPGNVYYYCS